MPITGPRDTTTARPVVRRGRRRTRSTRSARNTAARGVTASATVLAVALTAACGGAAATTPRPTSVPVTSTPRAASAHWQHVVIVVEENHSAGSIIGNPSAPYFNHLATTGANFTNYYAITHPSQPNYVALFSGSTQGLSDDSCPHEFAADNLGHQLLSSGRSFTGYSESLPSAGNQTCASGAYARKHAPWIDFTDLPNSVNQPFTSFPTDYSSLPTLSFVMPNLQHDMHDGTVAQADSWLKANLDAYARWAPTHHSLLVVTWDEDDHTDGNRIPTFAVGAGVTTGTSSRMVTHYSLLRTLEDGFGLTRLGSAASAQDITALH